MTWELKNSRVTGLVHCTAYLSRKSVRRFLYTIFCSPPCRWYCTDSSLTLAPFFHYAICFVQRHEEESVCLATVGYQRRFSCCCFVAVISLSMFHVIALITLFPNIIASLPFCRSGYLPAFMLALFILEFAPSQNNPLLSPRLASSLIYLISLSSHLLPLLLLSFSYPVVLQLDVLVAGAFPTRMPACEEFDYQECHLDATWMPPHKQSLKSGDLPLSLLTRSPLCRWYYTDSSRREHFFHCAHCFCRDTKKKSCLFVDSCRCLSPHK
jgi:hypothetical protein